MAPSAGLSRPPGALRWVPIAPALVEMLRENIFMNILTTNGYVSRFVTDWAGPEAMLRRISIRLGVPAVPGRTLRFTGQVAGSSREGDQRGVEVAIRRA